MILKKILAKICYPDHPDERIKALIDLYFRHGVTERKSEKNTIGIGIENNKLVIEVKKGFHCIFIPISDIKSLLKKEKNELEGEIYWVSRKDKDILIFHRGYVGNDGEPIGDIHIYEHKETLRATELQNQLKKYGRYLSWKIEDNV